ncbi:MAG: hypothetical protein KVP17_005095 [Porospora cf. gigantea B]|uniref:uncharacterized protein n=1 Tax=Porospora cf. gigantea B TaxID=2853592 RepID=UPI003571C886|nr:MAG: hypothetical protein KVP17_005095 [Porospora cf. gigantea B]
MRLVLYLGLVAVSSNSTTTIDVPSTLEVASTSEVPSTLEDVARDVQNMAGAHMMDNSLLDDEENDTIMGVGLLMDLLNGEQDADIETLKRAAELLANSDLDTDDDDDDDDGKSFFGLDEQNHGQQDHDLGLRIQPRSRNDNQWVNWKNNGLSMP